MTCNSPTNAMARRYGTSSQSPLSRIPSTAPEPLTVSLGGSDPLRPPSAPVARAEAQPAAASVIVRHNPALDCIPDRMTAAGPPKNPQNSAALGGLPLRHVGRIGF